MKIIKRSGSEVTFDISKIMAAVAKANKEVVHSERLSDEQIEATVTAIKEGDTQVSFDKDSSPQAVFGAYLKYLMNYGSDDFAKYRKFMW